jgi:uncharacterized membrane protein
MGQTLFLFLIMAFVIIILTIAQASMPYLTRKTQCFGISIPENQFDNPVFSAYRKSHMKQNIVLGVILLLILIISAIFMKNFIYVYTAAVFVEIAVSFIIYYNFHNKVKEYKNGAAWKDQTTSVVGAVLSSEKQEFISWAWLLIYPVYNYSYGCV